MDLLRQFDTRPTSPSDGPVTLARHLAGTSGSPVTCSGHLWMDLFFVFCCFFFCVPQLYLWGSPLLGEIFTYVTVF